jgi:hypothetical protein
METEGPLYDRFEFNTDYGYGVPELPQDGPLQLWFTVVTGTTEKAPDSRLHGHTICQIEIESS